MKPRLDMRNVAAGYNGSQVLFDLNLRIQAGEIVTLLGRNGMGKTTTVRALFGLIPTTQGHIDVDDINLNGLTPEVRARHGLALAPEGRRIFPNLSVRENLTAFAANWHEVPNPWRVDDVFALFPRLAQRARHWGHQLSGGEQQMLAIGRALMTNPKLLVLDEATEGLAPLVRQDIWGCLAELKKQGQSMLIIDKYADALAHLADRHIVLARGHVVWQGTSAALRDAPDIVTQYLAL